MLYDCVPDTMLYVKGKFECSAIRGPDREMSVFVRRMWSTSTNQKDRSIILLIISPRETILKQILLCDTCCHGKLPAGIKC